MSFESLLTFTLRAAIRMPIVGAPEREDSRKVNFVRAIFSTLITILERNMMHHGRVRTMRFVFLSLPLSEAEVLR